ncbi:P-loop containing nucleoside triphosphate hydrolase protein [Umbelopsis sp. AD052]|nr:P-loop containing nucleoside triphosphate hydrolase protein [Umbelopsis sp. AD052]
MSLFTGIHQGLLRAKPLSNTLLIQQRVLLILQRSNIFPLRHYTSECQSFEQLGISKPVSEHLNQNFGISKPTNVQCQLIPSILSGSDVLLKDSTGTGKSFAIAMALTAAYEPNRPSMYLTPNRELALQVSEWMEKISTDVPIRLEIAGEQERLRETVDVTSSSLTVGTASHIWSLIKEGKLQTDNWKTIAVDEADHAFRLPGRFANRKKKWNRLAHPKPAECILDNLISSKKSKPQIIISSATINRPLRHWLLQKKWIIDPKYIDGNSKVPATANVKHHCIVVSSDQVRNIQTTVNDNEKEETRDLDLDDTTGMQQDVDDSMMECLETLCDIEPVSQGIIFVQNDGSFKKVLHRLQKSGIKAIPLYNLISKGEKAQFYVATAMAGRGIDLQDISHVFIVGFPDSIGDYKHMAGRLGRLGQSTQSDPKVMTLAKDCKYIESKAAKMFKLMEIPITTYELIQ